MEASFRSDFIFIGRIMSSFPQFDLSKIRTQRFSDRNSKVDIDSFAKRPSANSSFVTFLNSLPNILAGPKIVEIASEMVAAKTRGKSVIASLGGHVVKTGMAPVINELIEQGYITAVAVNGALAIHDCEIALYGKTSEDVVAGLKTGTFGMSNETADFYNSVITTAASEGLGAGEALGRALINDSAPFQEYSILATCHKQNIPCTVHIALGTDIVHMHPQAVGSDFGDATLRDFRILAAAMENLSHGGVLLNLGSAVVLPEILLKAIAILRNVKGEDFTDYLGVNFDFIQQYRSNQQVVTRTESIGGRGIALTGHHEIMIPLLAQAVIELGHLALIESK